VSATLTTTGRIVTRVDFFEGFFFKKRLCYLAHDAITMAISIRKREQDLKGC
jgi:hypothetical protein